MQPTHQIVDFILMEYAWNCYTIVRKVKCWLGSMIELRERHTHISTILNVAECTTYVLLVRVRVHVCVVRSRMEVCRKYLRFDSHENVNKGSSALSIFHHIYMSNCLVSIFLCYHFSLDERVPACSLYTAKGTHTHTPHTQSVHSIQMQNSYMLYTFVFCFSFVN